jgi:aryl sulfotransferase
VTRSESPVHYQSDVEDSARWTGFEFRSGDIVISTRSKSGTTWLQMMCALLVFQRPDLPAPLAELSPWLDWLVEPLDEVRARLDAQQHRRVIKTHTPLDGIPIDARATYIVMAREPLDMAVSLYHQGDNLDRVRVRQLTGQPEPAAAPAPRANLHDWLLEWTHDDDDPRDNLDSLPGVMWHLSDAWQRLEQPNVMMLRFEDFLADLGGQMCGLADALGLPSDGENWSELVHAASFDQMRANATQLAPDSKGVLKDTDAFFRRGSSGAGRDVLSDGEYAAYLDRVSRLGAGDLVRWLHHSG